MNAWRQGLVLIGAVVGLVVAASPVVAQARVVVTGHVLSDNGDDDGFADPRETVWLYPVLENLGSEPATGVTVRLSALDAQLGCVTDSVIWLDDLAPGEVRLAADAFELLIADVERLTPFEELAASFAITVVTDTGSSERSLTLDLDLDVAGGAGAGEWTEGFEVTEGYGAFVPHNLDQGGHSHAASDGHRCQYSDPDWIAANVYAGPCILGASAEHADAFWWRVDGPQAPDGGRAFTGARSLHMGLPLEVGPGHTTPLQTLEAIGTAAPIHLAWDDDCSPNGGCVPAIPTLSFKHQVSLMDSRSTGLPPGAAADRGVVMLQLADGAGQPVGPWRKLEPFVNGHDQAGWFRDSTASCMFDPVDDGSTEDDFFDPTDPQRRLGPSSTCFPERVFAYAGDTDAPFDPGDVGHAEGPGLAGATGPGTWVESRVDLSRYRGRSVRLRFLTAGIEVSVYETWAALFFSDPGPSDDGWWIDDVHVDRTLASAASMQVDSNDNSSLPLPPDGDLDGVFDTCDTCPLVANAGQDDEDGDGTGDECDPCPLDPADDGDGDGLCCPADNCCLVPNPVQADADGDGTGDACDTDPVVLVSSDPGDEPDYPDVRSAIEAPLESGTRILIRPGLGPYAFPLTLDRPRLLHFEGLREPGEPEVVVDGGAHPAFDVLSSAGSRPMTLRNLTIRGAIGIRSRVPVAIEDCAFEANPTRGIELLEGQHRLERVVMGQTTGLGIRLRGTAGATIDRLRLVGLERSGVVMEEGTVSISNTLIARCGGTGVGGDNGSVEVIHSTVADNGFYGVAVGMGDLTVRASIVTGHGLADVPPSTPCSSIFHSLLGSVDCTGVNDNLQTNPGFADADYRLRPDSPAIDRGPVPAAYGGVPCLDLDGGPRLRDHDGDGLAQVDLGAYERENATLGSLAVSGLAWTAPELLGWDAVDGAVAYHVYRGALSTLGWNAHGTCRDDLDPSPQDTVLEDPEVPPPEEGFFYLITAESARSAEGTLGLGICFERSNVAPCLEPHPRR